MNDVPPLNLVRRVRAANRFELCETVPFCDAGQAGVVTESRAGDGEGVAFLEKAYVPNVGSLAGGRDNSRAVGAKGGRGDKAAMALELGEGDASRAVPNAGRFVFGGGDDSRAVWAEGDGDDTAAMALERNEGAPVAASQMRAVLSSEAVTTRAPSGLKAALT